MNGIAGTLKLLPLLPKARAWIRGILREHASRSHPVSELGARRLAAYYPESFLARAKVVIVPELPRPPVERWGLPGAESFKTLDASGITFKDTFFIKEGRQHDERLLFHELVHVVQWERLGVNCFLWLYGLYLVKYDYWNSPLETMARDLDTRFAREERFEALTAARQRTDEMLHHFRREGLGNRIASRLIGWL